MAIYVTHEGRDQRKRMQPDPGPILSAPVSLADLAEEYSLGRSTIHRLTQGHLILMTSADAQPDPPWTPQ